MRTRQLSQIIGVVILSLTTLSASAINVADIARAQAILTAAQKIMQQYRALPVQPVAPEPIADGTGKFVVPYTADGMTAEWAEKALTAKAGAALGAEAGKRATQGLMKQVPFGGLLAGKAKNKGASMGAVAAIGGWDYIRETSNLSFQDLDDLAVYMQLTHGDDADFDEALAAAMAIYPKLEKSYKRSVARAYKDAKKASKKK